MTKLTLSEMSERLNISPRTLRRYITTYKIPHIKIGNRLRFDASRVELHLESLAVNVKDPLTLRTVKPVRTKGDVNIKYAEALGL